LVLGVDEGFLGLGQQTFHFRPFLQMCRIEFKETYKKKNNDLLLKELAIE